MIKERYMCICVLVGTLGQNQNRHVAVLMGESATLYCNVYHYHGYVTWWQNSNIIVQSNQLLEKYAERFNFSCEYESYYKRCQMTILNAQLDDDGDYVCYSYYYRYIVYHTRVTIIRKL